MRLDAIVCGTRPMFRTSRTFMEPLIPRLWQESHQDWAMRTATLMQENFREKDKHHYVF